MPRGTKVGRRAVDENWMELESEPMILDDMVFEGVDVEVFHDGSDGFNVLCPKCGCEIFLGNIEWGSEETWEASCDNHECEYLVDVEIQAEWELSIHSSKVRVRQKCMECEEEEATQELNNGEKTVKCCDGCAEIMKKYRVV